MSSAVLDLIEIYDGEGAVIFSKFLHTVLNNYSPLCTSTTPDAWQTFLSHQNQCRGESICRFTELRPFVAFCFGGYQRAVQ